MESKTTVKCPVKSCLL